MASLVEIGQQILEEKPNCEKFTYRWVAVSKQTYSSNELKHFQRYQHIMIYQKTYIYNSDLSTVTKGLSCQTNMYN